MTPAWAGGRRGRDTEHQEMDKVFPEACGETRVRAAHQHQRVDVYTHTLRVQAGGPLLPEGL